MSFVVKAVKSVVKAVVNVVSKVVKAVVNVVSSVINFVTQPFMGLLGGQPDIPSAQAEADRQQGVLVQREGSNISIPVIYGYRKVGGIVVFAETGSTKNKYLYVAYVLSEGPIEGLREIFIDDWQLPAEQTATLNAGELITVANDVRYGGRVQLQYFPGIYADPPRSNPIGGFVKSGIFAESPSFTSDMVFNGLAVIFARYEWKDITTQADADNNPFSGNIPQLQATVLGRRIHSLTTNDTEENNYNYGAVRYSTNPAEILLDYLRNPRYGKGLLNNDIDWDTWKKAAVKCNQKVVYTASGVEGPILTANTVVDTQQTIFANVKTLLMGFRAYMPYVQGKYKLRIEDAGDETDILSGSAVIANTFTKDDIIGNVTYTGIEKSAKYNVVVISYVDPDQKFSVQQVIYPETEEERQVYIDLDGGRENKLEATFPTLTNYAMAKDMARLLFNKSRRQETCSLTVSSEALELEPGDCIRIQSNILNFNDDPWRIVSFKLNDNLSVDLGCVRNPDDIYPYVQAGQEDTVLPLFVPKGSTIYYPDTLTTIPIGLLPPTNAVYPSNYIGTSYNPGPTNPANYIGGGIGGGVSDTSNNYPLNPPSGTPFTGILSFKRSSITDWKNDTYTFDLRFIQPADSMYKFSIFWWRASAISPWQEVMVSTLPGPGGEIPISIGPLPKGTYEFYVRSYAVDGKASTQIYVGQFGYTDTLASDPTFAGFIGADTKVVVNGWQLPGLITPVGYHDDTIDSISIRPVSPQTNPRTVMVSMTQIVNTTLKPMNMLIKGVRIYYKLKADTYWSYEDIDYPANFLPGQTITKVLTDTFGVPNVITPGGVNDNLQKYDFLARLTYKDGVIAQRQVGPATAPIQEFNGVTDYIAWGTNNLSAVKVSSQPISVDFNNQFKTIDQDPNAAYATGLDIVANINSVRFLSNTSSLLFFFNQPTNSKFRGFRIRMRPVTVGTNPSFKQVDTGYISFANPGYSISNDVIGWTTQNLIDFKIGSRYDMVITALVSTVAGIVEATNSLVTRVYLDSEPKPTLSTQTVDSVNLYSRLNFTIADTLESVGKLKVTFPVDPVINAFSWTKKFGVPKDTVNNLPIDIEKNLNTGTGALSFYMNAYYRLKFQMPSSATHIVMYRRLYNAQAAAKTTVTTTSKYYGLGPWEKVRIAKSALSTDASGFYILNVRGPIGQQYFNNKYGVTVGAPLVSTSYGSSGQFPYPGGFLPNASNIYPYYGVGNNSPLNIDPTADRVQYLFVIDTSGVESASGLLLTDFWSYENIDGFKTEFEGFGDGTVAKQTVTDTTIFNSGIDSGFGRRLSEAITTSISTANLFHVLTPSVNIRLAPPTRDAYGQAFSYYLQAPKSGDTVY